MNRITTSLILSIGLFAAGCNDDEPAAPSTGGGGGGGGGSTTISSSTVESVTFTVDGVTRTYTNGANNAGIVFTNSGSTGSPYSYKTYGCTFANMVTDESYIEFSLGQFEMDGAGIPSSTEFFGWFGTGEVPYGNTGGEVDKAEVHMYDPAPLFTEWSTSCGTQSGASFNVTQVVQIPNSLTYDKVKYRVTFNCKLYNCGGGGTPRTITNGVAVVLVESSI